MPYYIAALDQGTTSSRCIIFDESGSPAGLSQIEFKQYYPQPGWVEHDPMEIWTSQKVALAEAKARSGAAVKDIAAIGITNQRETVIVWDRETGRPIYNAIVWQCRRTAPFCDELVRRGVDRVIKEKTGLVVDAYFSAAKIRWILDNVRGARKRAERGGLAFGTVDSWLLWNLTGGKVHATDYTNASRTMLFNIHTLKWDKELLEIFGIPESMLPEVRPSSGHFGNAGADFLGTEIPVLGIAGDQQAALFGQCCFESGMVKNTYGTGCFILMNTGEKAAAPSGGLLTTIAWNLGGKTVYALEGSVFIAGAAVQWLRDELKLIPDAASTEAMAESVESALGVYFVPAFTGVGAPHWAPYARGSITGLTRGVRREHIVRAALEAIAFQSADVISAMETCAGKQIKEIRADGGASANNFLLKFQADILNKKVIRPRLVETTALGAASLAGLACGIYSSPHDVQHKTHGAKVSVFTPSMKEAERKAALSGWQKAVENILRH